MAALCSKGGVTIFTDELNHASLIDGIRMAARKNCNVCIYRHCDYTHLRQLLEACPHTHRKLVVTDGVFSMDGDLANLQACTDVAWH